MVTETTGSANEPEVLPEVHLWQAVIASTVQEWIHGPLRRKRDAERYIFGEDTDFRLVCKSAGMDPERLRARLAKFRDRAALDTEVRSQRN